MDKIYARICGHDVEMKPRNGSKFEIDYGNKEYETGKNNIKNNRDIKTDDSIF